MRRRLAEADLAKLEAKHVRARQKKLISLKPATNSWGGDSRESGRLWDRVNPGVERNDHNVFHANNC
jgi:hypothetical protein